MLLLFILVTNFTLSDRASTSLLHLLTHWKLRRTSIEIAWRQARCTTNLQKEICRPPNNTDGAKPQK